MPWYKLLHTLMQLSLSLDLNLKNLNNIIRNEAGVANNWYTLGVELLDSNTVVLDVIKTNHQRDDDRCSEMFKTWLEMKPDASWSQLISALTEINLQTAADNIEWKIMFTEGTVRTITT